MLKTAKRQMRLANGQDFLPFNSNIVATSNAADNAALKTPGLEHRMVQLGGSGSTLVAGVGCSASMWDCSSKSSLTSRAELSGDIDVST